MSDIISLGLWIKRRRKALDLTQAALAQRVGCSLDLIQKIEADARRPSREMAARLADMLDLAADERAPFIQAARAERGADRLAPPTQSVVRSAFAPAAESQPAPTAAPAPPLPSGTVTFLFTDIEGSTRLWEQYPQAMPAALARHDALLHEITIAHGGVVFKTVGDSVLAAFAHAPVALAVALAAQRAIRTEAWELPEPPRVRMVLHSGTAEIRNGDYFGAALNRAARLLAAGHGGQVLLSLATAQLVREHLPPDAALRDLGTHRLKDLSLPEQIFQLVAPDLAADFPALHTLDARRTNLPAQPTPLIGREQEIAAVATLLRRSDVRLVTLTGPGGIGKTRLSLQVAVELVEEFADGVHFVDLAPIREPSLVISAIAQTLEIRETGGQPLITQLQQFLSDKRMLLLLDNFEQVLDAAPLLADLLATASRLTLLMTSREVLHLRGEKEMAVPPLAVPPATDDGRRTTDDKRQSDVVSGQWSVVTDYSAVQLFIQRARDAQPDFQITSANAAAVAEICARLDGLPLAIELAAARSKLFAPDALLARLHSRMALLTGGARDLPLRQQTIRTTIAWSYDLLTEAEQTLFRRLGVFVGGCTLEAAEAVCAQGKGPKVKGKKDDNTVPVLPFTFSLLPLFAALLDKSLVRQVAGPSGDPRFVMLETIREYALEQLEASGEAEQLRRQHASYYLAFGSQRSGEDEGSWILRIDREYDNLRAALVWSQTRAGDPEVALRLSGTLTELWYARGVRSEGIALLERTLNHPLGLKRTALHVEVRMYLAQLFAVTGNFAAACVQYEQALSLSRELGDTHQQAIILERLGWVAREQGDSATAWQWTTKGLALFRELDDRLWSASTLNTMAGIAILEEDPARAEALLAESRALAQQAGASVDPYVGFWTLNHLGHAAQLRGAFDRAVQFHQQSLALLEPDYSHWAVHLAAYHDLGATTLGLGRLEEARRWLIQALATSRMLGEQPVIAWCLAGLGTAAALDEEPERAARLWGAAEALRKAIGCRPAPAARTTYERALVMARAQLGEEAFAVAWAEGRALPLEQVIAEALVKPKAL